MSVIQKLDQGYLSANYPRPNNAFTRFTEYSEEAVWVLERRPNIEKTKWVIEKMVWQSSKSFRVRCYNSK